MLRDVGKLRHAWNLLRFILGAGTPVGGPLRVQWDITSRCNSRCRHCHRWEANDYDQRQLSLEEGRKLIAELATIGTVNLSFAGNEPLLRTDIFDLVAYANKQGLVTNLNSNGWLVDTAVAQELCASGLDMIYLSLDGATPQTHDSLRGVPGSFDRVWNAVALIQKARGNWSRPQIMINTVVNRENCGQILDIARLCRGHRVDGLLVQPLHVAGTQFEANDDLKPGETELPVIRQELHVLAREFAQLTPLTPEYYQHFETFFRSPSALFRYRCLAAYFTADIRSNGDITPCPAWNERLGNLVDDGSFVSAWTSPRARLLRERIRRGQHPVCWFACVVPINLIAHDLRTGRLDRLLRPRLLAHILRKVGKK